MAACPQPQITGVIPQKAAPELPKSKRSKVVDVDSVRSVHVDNKGSGNSDTVMTTAYTVSRRDNANLLAMTKNPLSMTLTDQRDSPVVRANDNGMMRSTAPSLKDSSK